MDRQHIDAVVAASKRARSEARWVCDRLHIKHASKFPVRIHRHYEDKGKIKAKSNLLEAVQYSPLPPATLLITIENPRLTRAIPGILKGKGE